MSDVIDADLANALLKFHKDQPFADPVVVCDSCQMLLLREELHEHGMCKHCGNTRVRNLRVVSEADMALLRAWAETGKIDADFVRIFEAVE